VLELAPTNWRTGSSTRSSSRWSVAVSSRRPARLPHRAGADGLVPDYIAEGTPPDESPEIQSFLWRWKRRRGTSRDDVLHCRGRPGARRPAVRRSVAAGRRRWLSSRPTIMRYWSWRVPAMQRGFSSTSPDNRIVAASAASRPPYVHVIAHARGQGKLLCYDQAVSPTAVLASVSPVWPSGGVSRRWGLVHFSARNRILRARSMPKTWTVPLGGPAKSE